MNDVAIDKSNSPLKAKWHDYWELCKPRVVVLMMITAWVGMHLATNHPIPLRILICGNLGIALAAGAAASINHLIDRHIDPLMARTKKRPVASGRLKISEVLIFAGMLASLGMFLLIHFVNTLTAILTFCTLIGYAGVYTVYLKHATPQNIVIGGAAGAAPPLLGWVAVTGHVDPQALLLMLIIFVWTPPHFWALAIHRYDEYAQAEIPMLPVTHGIPFTKMCIFLYSLLLWVCSCLPYVIGMSGAFYLCLSTPLNAIFLLLAAKLLWAPKPQTAMRLFWYSIIYLALLFLFLSIDHLYIV